MSNGTKTESKKDIAEVFLSIEARQFWERVYLALIPIAGKTPLERPMPELADAALDSWKERFEPKAGE